MYNKDGVSLCVDMDVLCIRFFSLRFYMGRLDMCLHVYRRYMYRYIHISSVKMSTPTGISKLQLYVYIYIYTQTPPSEPTHIKHNTHPRTHDFAAVTVPLVGIGVALNMRSCQVTDCQVWHYFSSFRAPPLAAVRLQSSPLNFKPFSFVRARKLRSGLGP